jgi:hypothetical protein
MPPDVLSSPQFYAAVRALRAMPERFRFYAHFAATFWDDDQIVEAERNGDVPGNPGELPPAQLQ